MFPQEDRFKEVLQKAINYCTYQERCRSEVKKKLVRLETPEGWIPEILETLEEENFLDEKRYARVYSHGKFSNNKWGRVKIRSSLRMMKIPEEIIEEGLSEIDEELYANEAHRLAQRKLDTLGKLPTVKKRQKLSNYLLSKGFETGLVFQTVDDLLSPNKE